jgi:diacylglycerol kinase family enzyme
LFGNKESFADGQVEANILMVRSILGYARLFWQLLRNPQGRKDELRKLTVRDRILIDAVGRSQPVQADGELIGKTPVEIQIVHKTLQVIVPPHSREA